MNRTNKVAIVLGEAHKMALGLLSGSEVRKDCYR